MKREINFVCNLQLSDFNFFLKNYNHINVNEFLYGYKQQKGLIVNEFNYDKTNNYFDISDFEFIKIENVENDKETRNFEWQAFMLFKFGDEYAVALDNYLQKNYNSAERIKIYNEIKKYTFNEKEYKDFKDSFVHNFVRSHYHYNHHYDYLYKDLEEGYGKIFSRTVLEQFEIDHELLRTL